MSDGRPDSDPSPRREREIREIRALRAQLASVTAERDAERTRCEAADDGWSAALHRAEDAEDRNRDLARRTVAALMVADEFAWKAEHCTRYMGLWLDELKARKAAESALAAERSASPSRAYLEGKVQGLEEGGERLKRELAAAEKARDEARAHAEAAERDLSLASEANAHNMAEAVEAGRMLEIERG
jgi:hypothetical protein